MKDTESDDRRKLELNGNKPIEIPDKKRARSERRRIGFGRLFLIFSITLIVFGALTFFLPKLKNYFGEIISSMLLALGVGFLPLGIRGSFFEDEIRMVFTELLEEETNEMVGKVTKEISTVTKELGEIIQTGVERVFSSRDKALKIFLERHFTPSDEDIKPEDKWIEIVGSSLKGIIGTVDQDGNLMQNETQKDFYNKLLIALNKDWDVKIFLTHPAFADLRSLAECRGPGEIREEIISNLENFMKIDDFKNKLRSGKLKINLFQGSPTIFILATSRAMLLNPYFYSSTAMENICMEIHPVEFSSGISLYRVIRESHIGRPWDSVCTTPIRCEKDLMYIKRQDEGCKKNLHRFIDCNGFIRRDYYERQNVPSSRRECKRNCEYCTIEIGG